MNYFDLLQTIAGLAITLIGFVGIVATAGRLVDPERKPIDQVLFYSMIGPSVTILACVFVPQLALSAGASSGIAWGVANGSLGLLHLANILPALLQLRRMKFTTVQKCFLTSGVTMIGAHALAASGLLYWVQFVFLLGLLQQLAVAIFMFLQLVQTGRGGVEPPQAPAGGRRRKAPQ